MRQPHAATPRQGPADAVRDKAIDETFGAMRRSLGLWNGIRRRVLGRDLNPERVMVLRFIHDHGHTTAGQVAAFAGLTQGAVTPVLDRLEADGHIQRKRSTTDRRVIELRLTPQATQMMDRLADQARHYIGDLFDGWTIQEITALGKLLEKFVARSPQGA